MTIPVGYATFSPRSAPFLQVLTKIKTGRSILRKAKSYRESSWRMIELLVKFTSRPGFEPGLKAICANAPQAFGMSTTPSGQLEVMASSR